MSEQLISTETAETYLNVPRNTLAKFRVTGGGPAFHKIGRRVRYRLSDLDAWLANRRYDSTSAHSASKSAGS